MRLAPGWPWYALPPLLVGVALIGLWPITPLAIAGSIVLVGLAVFVIVFFRDPEREIGDGIVAAADGQVTEVDEAGIVTFLNVHDVHVIRAPYAGRVERVRRFTGPRLPAFLKGAKRNAGVSIHLETPWGPQEVRLIAGLIARRAVAWVEPGDEVDKGERIGMIRFSSRVDVELPEGSRPRIEPGEKATAGETTLALSPDRTHREAPTDDDEEGAA